MLGSLVLRDIPKEEARLDLIHITIRGGFRGFTQIPPGYHYVSVKHNGFHTGFWFWMRPGEVIVKRFTETGQWVDEDEETTAQFTEMAKSGSMNQVLFAYPMDQFPRWFTLVSALSPTNLTPVLHTEDSGEGSRFEKAFVHTHASNPDSFLTEFQAAFVRWMVSLDEETHDEIALNRWRHLLLALYNAGERGLLKAQALIPPLMSTLLGQFSFLPDEWFAPDSFITSQANYLAEDLIDTDEPELAAKGREFQAYLKGAASMKNSFVLWTDVEKKHYYRLPADKKLPAGEFVIQTLNGKESQTVDPIFLSTYLLSAEEAKEAVQAEMNQLWEQAKPVINNFLGVLAQDLQEKAAEKLKPAENPSPNIVTSLLGATPAEIGDNPDLLKEKLTGWINQLQVFLHNATSEDGTQQEAAREQMRHLRATFDAHGWATTDELEQVPDKLRENYNSPERASNEARIANALRELAEQIAVAGEKISDQLHTEANKIQHIPPAEKDIEA